MRVIEPWWEPVSSFPRSKINLTSAGYSQATDYVPQEEPHERLASIPSSSLCFAPADLCCFTARRLKKTLKPWPVGLATLVLGVSFLNAGCATTFVPSDAKAICTVTTNGAPAFASWFESGTVTLNGVVKPANSVTFPNTPNCSFYQWSEQMFLWMTSPAPATYGGGGGRIFDSPAFFRCFASRCER